MNKEQNIPQGYKDSPLGVIPQEWKVQRLGEVVDPNRKISYGIVQTGELIPNGVPCIRVIDLVDGKIDKTKLITTSPDISYSYRKTIVKDGDIVVALRGKIGESVLITTDLSGCNLTRGVALISNCRDISSKFLIQQINSPLMQIEFKKKMNGSALQEIPINVLRNIETVIPPLEEQRRIAEVLGVWDEAIERQAKLVALLETRKRALMQHLLTPKPHWQEKTIEEICIVGRGRVISKEEIISNHGDYPVYSSQTDNNGEFGKINTYDFEGEYITWTTDGVNAGTVFYRNGKFNCTNVCGTLKTDNNINAKFIAYKLSTIAYKYVSRTLANPKLMNNIMKEIPISIPIFNEQKAIAEKLSNTDTEIDLAKRRLDLYHTQKRALMQQLLTGKKRIKYD